jgi:D-alanine-D-alanine ligase
LSLSRVGEERGFAPVESRAGLTVAVLAGGPSAEHEVSLASAGSVRDGLLEAGHAALWVEVDREGAWRHDGRRLSLCPAAGLLGADVAFPALHGRYGEDGTVQGVLEALAVPYVGSGVAASSLCMNKVLFKDLMSAHGVPQVRYAAISAASFRADPRAARTALAALGLPLFVKPVHMGSSLGIAKVTSAEQFEPTLSGAFEHDQLVIAEAGAAGIEVECAVLGSPLGAAEEELVVSEPGEITYAGDWYDYATKYTPGAMELVIPARISASARERLRELAAMTFRRTGCDGLARVDFFVDGERVLVNELNTMPGFTPTSVYAKLLGAGGISYPRLVDRLCRLALARGANLARGAALARPPAS